jgi:hypothetical protein
MEINKLKARQARIKDPTDAGIQPVPAHSPLLVEVRQLIDAARQRVASAVNAELTQLYWHIGRPHQRRTAAGAAGRIRQAVKRSPTRFPQDFMFQLSADEFTTLRSQTVTSNTGRSGRRTAPYAFTEQGVAMDRHTLHAMTNRKAPRNCEQSAAIHAPAFFNDESPHVIRDDKPERTTSFPRRRESSKALL